MRQASVLPSKPKAEIFVDVFGFVNASLKSHDYVGHQLQILENQPLAPHKGRVQEAAGHAPIASAQCKVFDLGACNALHIS